MNVTWLGHAAVLVETGTHRILIDPFLTGNPAATRDPAEFEVDAVLVTHGHSDHLGDAIAIATRCKAPIIAPFELAKFCERQGAPVHPMHIGGSFRFPFGLVKLTMALHGSAFIDEGTEYTGNPCGFLISCDGKTLYHAGDTGLFGDMRLIGELNRIDLALLPIGDNFTMGPLDAARAAEMLRARHAVPIHYNTWELIHQDPALFVADLPSTCEGHILAVNDSLEL